MKKLLIIFGFIAFTFAVQAQTSSDNGTGKDDHIQALSTDGTSTDVKSVIDVLPYPNPGTGRYNMKLNISLDIEVYNATGLLVYKKSVQPGTNAIDLGNQPNGMYFAKFISKEDKIIENQTLVKF